jgi:SAM-dependent methyltransferase
MAGGDQQYLREVQYGDLTRLAARANLHIKYSTAPIEWYRWVVAQTHWPPNAQVLEVGCGPGGLWVNAADDLPSGLRLTLTDLSPAMVAAARDRVQDLAKYAAVRAEEADAQQLPFADASFDVVVGNHMLYHVPDPARAVAELARVLRDDGVVIAATNGPHHLVELWEIRAEVFGPAFARDEGVEVFGPVSGLPTLNRWFEYVEWREYDDELRCTDPNDVIAFITSAPPGEDASAEQLLQLDRAVRSRFDADGMLTVSRDTGVFLCRDPRARRL